MASDEAGRALSLISHIGLCKDASAFTWRSVVTRVVLEADEAGDDAAVARVRALLEGLWDRLPDATGDPGEAWRAEAEQHKRMNRGGPPRDGTGREPS
jgi:hypothetical protein